MSDVKKAVVQLFSDVLPEPEFDFPLEERRVSGNPKRTTWSHFVNDSGEVYMGVWASEVGAWHIEMGPTEDEYFYVIEGRGRIVGDLATKEFAAGDAVVIPAGFKGVFEVVETLKKHYVIVERQK
ncbi:MAG: cupin domain-containing protein [Formosimonas sp.]